MFTHAGFLIGIGARRTWTDSCDTTITLVLLFFIWKGIGKGVLTGRDVEGASNVVLRVGEWGLGIVSIRVGVWTVCTIEMTVLSA